MTGPEHYAKAEQVVAQVEDRDVSAAMVTAFTAVAQVHATLAAAAAAALNDPQGGMGGNDWHAWHDAVSVDAMKVSEATP